MERLKPAYVELHKEKQYRTYDKTLVSSARSHGSSDLEGGKVATVTFSELRSTSSTLKQSFRRKAEKCSHPVHQSQRVRNSAN